jgi:CDGSH-type Zn-finger protein
VEARLELKALKVEKEKAEALAEKRKSQTLCGCGSYYNNDFRGICKVNHLVTAKHNKWENKQKK